MNGPTFLVIGHIVRDLVADGYRPGGTALYASLAAMRLGQRVAVVTSTGPELDPQLLLPGAWIRSQPAPATTTFVNTYCAGGRVQHVRSVAATLSQEQVPCDWRSAPIVLLAPLVHEVPSDLAAAFPGALVGAAAQGWLRAWDEDGRVRPAPWRDARQVLPHLGALVLSEEDVGGDWGVLEGFARQVPVLAVTQGRRGATVFFRRERHRFPAHEVVEVDPTGAGDVFAAAFLVELARGGDPAGAARFANAAASFVVERPGVDGVPTLADVLSRLGPEVGNREL